MITYTIIKEEIESLTADKIFASCVVNSENGGRQDVIPILALYNGGNIEKIVIGSIQTITGTGLVEAEIDLTGMVLNENHKLKMFVWSDMTMLKPVLINPGILQM